MGNWFFLCIQFIICLIRWPLRLLLWPMALISSSLRERLDFEGQNNLDNFSISFKREKMVAHIAFEVASEGEFEQIYPLIESFLHSGQRVELIFSSPSVQRKCTQLARNWPQQIRLLRFPLLNFSFFGAYALWNWVTAPKMILLRYDFYPEIFLWQKWCGVKLYLFSATLKGKENFLNRPGTFFHEYWRSLYSNFSQIYCASSIDLDRFSRLGLRDNLVGDMDFRVLRIFQRLSNKEKTLELHPPASAFGQLLVKFTEKKMILGNSWPLEMESFRNEKFRRNIHSGKTLVVLAPHRLDLPFLQDLRSHFYTQDQFSRLKLPLYEVSVNTTEMDLGFLWKQWEQAPGPWLFTVPGVLCEFYSFFDYAYVGGGFGRSVHSLLEPFLAGCNTICGERTHRSTECDFIMNHAPDRLRVIDQLGQIDEASELFVPLNIAPLLLNINESYKKKLNNIVGQLNHDHS
jgi:3-deoxy-D-manno-octulosonic-acid transferase